MLLAVINNVTILSFNCFAHPYSQHDCEGRPPHLIPSADLISSHFFVSSHLLHRCCCSLFCLLGSFSVMHVCHVWPSVTSVMSTWTEATSFASSHFLCRVLSPVPPALSVRSPFSSFSSSCSYSLACPDLTKFCLIGELFFCAEKHKHACCLSVGDQHPSLVTASGGQTPSQTQDCPSPRQWSSRARVSSDVQLRADVVASWAVRDDSSWLA